MHREHVTNVDYAGPTQVDSIRAVDSPVPVEPLCSVRLTELGTQRTRPQDPSIRLTRQPLPCPAAIGMGPQLNARVGSADRWSRAIRDLALPTPFALECTSAIPKRPPHLGPELINPALNPVRTSLRGNPRCTTPHKPFSPTRSSPLAVV